MGINVSTDEGEFSSQRLNENDAPVLLRGPVTLALGFRGNCTHMKVGADATPIALMWTSAGGIAMENESTGEVMYLSPRALLEIAFAAKLLERP